MSIPSFQEDGVLPAGTWKATGKQFIGRFCLGETRQPFAKAVQDILDFATSTNATRVLFGGSFVTSAPTPRDLDCVIVFEAEIQIPDRGERLAIEGTSLDIFFCAEDQPAILSAFVTLFSETRFMKPAGIVEVQLFGRYGRPLWQIVHQPDDDTLEIVKRVYFQRHIIDRNNSRKALITIHGIRSYGDWNSEVVHVASSNGWIIAPFTYGYVNASVFARGKEKARIVDEFRKHVDDVYHRYRCDISVIAHSFGTYVVAKYLLGFDEPPVSFDTVISTGSILNEDLDIDRFEGRAYRVVNEVAPNDAAVTVRRSGRCFGRFTRSIRCERIQEHVSAP